MEKDWAYIDQCKLELLELIDEIQALGKQDIRDLHYYNYMLKLAIEDLEFELRR